MTTSGGLCNPETYATLTQLAATITDGCIVEIGTYKGHGTVALAQGAQPEVQVFTVDTHDMPGDRFSTALGRHSDRINFTRTAIREEARERIGASAIMVQGHSEIIGMTWPGPPVGMIMIDGDHRQGAVRRDFAAWEHHLLHGAIVCFDDYHSLRYPGVVRVVRNLQSKRLLTDLSVYGTLAVARYR